MLPKESALAKKAHVILPLHRELDQLREMALGEAKIGTTGRGIGPSYEDKIGRRGLRVGDLFNSEDPNVLAEKVRALVKFYNLPDHAVEKNLAWLAPLIAPLKPYVFFQEDGFLETECASKRILFEGAQGALLDVDHGTYPFVTSSNTVASQAFTGSGLGIGQGTAAPKILGIFKAYTTRVGAGHFPTEIETTDPALALKIRERGKEFGATTGRTRRIGWLDLVALRTVLKQNGATHLAMMKSDVLSEIETIRVATHYRIGKKEIRYFPAGHDRLTRAEPFYQDFAGWGALGSTPTAQLSEDDLPSELRNYIAFIEKELELPISIFSYGPGREQTLLRK